MTLEELTTPPTACEIAVCLASLGSDNKLGHILRRMAFQMEFAGSEGIRCIMKERRRQIEGEGFSPEHDDAYTGEELVDAAACYLQPTFGCVDGVPLRWPWEADYWKPGDRIRELSKAGALIAAEIEPGSNDWRNHAKPHQPTPDEKTHSPARQPVGAGQCLGLIH